MTIVNLSTIPDHQPIRHNKETYLIHEIHINSDANDPAERTYNLTLFRPLRPHAFVRDVTYDQIKAMMYPKTEHLLFVDDCINTVKKLIAQYRRGLLTTDEFQEHLLIHALDLGTALED